MLLLGQRAHLLRNHRETFAVLAGASGFAAAGRCARPPMCRLNARS
jgi:hypothetical protein